MRRLYPFRGPRETGAGARAVAGLLCRAVLRRAGVGSRSMRDADDLSPLDRLRAGIALFLAAALLSFPLTFGARFAKMFRDFGSPSDLPSITRFALAPWFGPLLGTLAALPAIVALVN